MKLRIFFKRLFSREVRIGFLFIASAAILFFVFNYLKGVNIFNPTNYYYTVYQEIDGLGESCPVFIKGHKIGQVSLIDYDFSKDSAFVITLDISTDITLPIGTTAELIDDGLMGGKAIALNLAQDKGIYYETGAYLESVVGHDIVSKISNSIMPKIDHLLASTDSLITSLRRITDGAQMKHSLNSIEKASSDLEVSSGEIKKLMKGDLPNIVRNVDKFTEDFAAVGSHVKNIDFEKTVANVDQTMAELQGVAAKINNSQGSLGKLINDSSLYYNLNNASKNADRLLIDLKQNPKQYVHFSIW